MEMGFSIKSFSFDSKVPRVSEEDEINVPMALSIFRDGDSQGPFVLGPFQSLEMDVYKRPFL